MISSQGETWFALYTRHQHEKTAARILSGKGIEVCLPLYNTVHRWKDRVKTLSLPLFPNYVFVFASGERFGAVLRTPGVYDFVRQGGFPAPVPAEDINAIQRIIERGLSAEPHPFLKCGDRARVVSGPLEGLEGILTRKKNFYRLVLSVDALERSISVEVETADVERVRSGNGATAFPSPAGTFQTPL